jgi:hypothetical protein
MARTHSKKFRAEQAAAAKLVAEEAQLFKNHSAPCPKCGERGSTATILYGLPAFDEELNRRLESGLVALGGCDIFEDQPEFVCCSCTHKWRDSPNNLFNTDALKRAG